MFIVVRLVKHHTLKCNSKTPTRWSTSAMYATKSKWG